MKYLGIMICLGCIFLGSCATSGYHPSYITSNDDEVVTEEVANLQPL